MSLDQSSPLKLWFRENKLFVTYCVIIVYTTIVVSTYNMPSYSRSFLWLFILQPLFIVLITVIAMALLIHFMRLWYKSIRSYWVIQLRESAKLEQTSYCPICGINLSRNWDNYPVHSLNERQLEVDSVMDQFFCSVCRVSFYTHNKYSQKKIRGVSS